MSSRRGSSEGGEQTSFVSLFQNKLQLPIANPFCSARDSGGSKDIAFTVPPSLSPLSPRRPFPPPSPTSNPRKSFQDSLSPLCPRRSIPDGSKAFDGGLLSPLIPRRFGGGSGESSPHGAAEAINSNLVETSSFSHSSTNIANLGALDPELYKTAGDVLPGDLPCYPHDHLGRVWYRLEYRDDCEKLLVTLLKVRNLPSRNTSSHHSCDPYVKLVLMPDERRCLQTRRKQNTCNPRYDHTFAFMVGAKELTERALKLTVYDVDRDRKHNIIGHAIHLFKDRGAESSPLDGREVFYKDLTRETIGSPRELGQLEVTLCYNDNLERLTVILGASKGVKVPEECRGSGELQVRVSLLQQAKVVKTKKSSEVRPNSHGETGFHESFMFRVNSESLDTAALTILVHQARKSAKDVTPTCHARSVHVTGVAERCAP
ncbi:synaptotagmin-15-like [Hyalella azteca]|uniref:Synaptotagmin-15-like n=1 Tax=Hyalella azteca TaxID=294128 RepID=A0A979FQ83_HYAAZ|nr:synaptotagmin-15-like [Hyalella azteca]